MLFVFRWTLRGGAVHIFEYLRRGKMVLFRGLD